MSKVVTITNGKGEEFELVHGKTYDLGATEGKYNASEDTFSMGSCFVHRSETQFSGDITQTRA